jgi:hypothetical protein
MHEAQDEEIVFALRDIELELTVEVTAEGKTDAGIRFWLVSAGGSAGASRTGTHTLRLTLTPETEEVRLRASHASALIAVTVLVDPFAVWSEQSPPWLVRLHDERGAVRGAGCLLDDGRSQSSPRFLAHGGRCRLGAEPPDHPARSPVARALKAHVQAAVAVHWPRRREGHAQPFSIVKK